MMVFQLSTASVPKPLEFEVEFHGITIARQNREGWARTLRFEGMGREGATDISLHRK
jgi:hypothetical protein